MFESDVDRLAILKALGGADVDSPLGTFTGLFENDFLQVGELVDSSQPRITARTSDVKEAEVVSGVEVTIEGEAYIVRSVQNDGSGMTTLILETQ